MKIYYYFVHNYAMGLCIILFGDDFFFADNNRKGNDKFVL